MRERRYKKRRVPRRVFLVICEGETERAYIELLKRRYRVPVTVKTKVSGNQINARLVREYLRELELEQGDDYRVFYIYDADVESVMKKLMTLEGVAILTNPCIELWFLLHCIDHSRATTSGEVVKLLCKSHEAWRNYCKGELNSDQTKMLTSNIGEAVRRAKRLTHPENPSSNFYDFVEALENAILS